MQFLIEIIGAGVLLPAAVSVALLMVSQRGGKKFEALSPLAASLGFFAGYAALSWTALRPNDAWHWLPWLALIAAAAEIISRKWLTPAQANLLRATVAALAGLLLVDAQVPARAVVIAGFGGAMLVLWLTVDESAARLPGASISLILLGVAAAGSALLMLAGNAKFAQLGGILSAALGGTTLVAWRYSRVPLARDAVPCVVVVLLGLMLAGYLNNFSDVSLPSFLLVAFSPLGLAAGRLGVVQKFKLPVLIQGAVVLVAACMGVVLAVIQNGLPEE